MPRNRLIGPVDQFKVVSANVLYNDFAPFLVGEPIYVDSLAGTTLYGANHPGDLSTTKFARFRQTVASNFGFELPSAVNTPQNTTGGALSAANQLRVVIMVDAIPRLRMRGDQDPGTSQAAIGAGGGTMIGDTTMVFHAAVAANAVTSLIKSSGANVKTLIPGDRMTITEGSLTETVTVTRAFTANGTTQVTLSHTPTVNAYTTAAVLTFVAATGKAVILGASAPSVGAEIEVAVLDASDVVTVGNTGGALTAGQLYQAICPDFVHTAGSVNMTKAMSH